MATQRIRSGTLSVDGLTELRRDLKALGKDLPKELRKANKSVADYVADLSASAAYSLGGVAAHVAPSIKASAGQISAGVTFGGSAYPMAGGAEFGSQRYKQFKPWRGNGSDAGYFVYPTIRDNAERIESHYTDVIDDLLERVGLA